MTTTPMTTILIVLSVLMGLSWFIVTFRHRLGRSLPESETIVHITAQLTALLATTATAALGPELADLPYAGQESRSRRRRLGST